ncbi:MAG: sigma-70 family RNA polymerase sigma factor [Oscillospiraceae bacterium]|nr:sigma-70 family RNA polymerase sigma factor [Oscillospiraceae bacterium]
MKRYYGRSDGELVHMTLSGDTNAYGELVARHKNMVYNAAYGVVHEHYTAEDIAQDSFVDGFMQLSRLSEPDKFPGWIYAVARRKALHFVSRRQLHADIDNVPAASAESDPLTRILKDERINEIRAAVDTLSDKNRAVAELFYFEDKNVSRIAALLALPEGTIKRRLHEARKKLKERLGYMNEMRNEPSAGFETAVKNKIAELSDYVKLHGFDSDYNKMSGELVDYVVSLPESEGKMSAAEDVAETLKYMFFDEYVGMNDNWEEAIKFFDTVAVPKMDSLKSDDGMSYMLFWRGICKLSLRRRAEAQADFKESVRLSKPSDITHALSVSAVRIVDLLEENAEDDTLGFNISAEGYRYENGKLMFRTQPGFTSGRQHESLSCASLGYYLSRCGDIMFDTKMKVGDVRISDSGRESLALIALDESITVPAGAFECMHLTLTETGRNADVWYSKDVGLIKAIFSGSELKNDEVYELAEYEIKGGKGYWPLCEGNRWRYENPGVPDYIYYRLEYAVDWTDGTLANLSYVTPIAYKKNYVSEYCMDSDMYIDQCDRHCDNWEIDEAIEALRLAVKENSSQQAALAALGGIEYLEWFRELNNKKYRFCPSSYAVSRIGRRGDKIFYSEGGVYRFGPYRFGTRSEENRIFGYKPLRYLEILCDCVWDDSWVDGYSCAWKYDDADVTLTVDKTGEIIVPAGTFRDCLKVTVTAEVPGLSGDCYFDDYAHTWRGKKEYWFASGVGIVRFDCTWGDVLDSSAQLINYRNPAGAEGYFPLALGCEWEYDEVNMTREGYCAKRIMKVMCGMNEQFLTQDISKGVFLGTEEEYEEFKRKISKNN